MEQLFEMMNIKLRGINHNFRRFLYNKIDWSNRLIAITGARGTGKTTLLLQYINNQFKTPGNLVLYADVNHFYFTRNTLLDLANEFYKKGGKFLFLDEIHKYANWSSEIKQIYDTWHDLKIVFTGSSILEIYKGEADLSRRLVRYFLPGLSFREFLELDQGLVFESFELQSIINHHHEITGLINEKIRPLEFFEDYIKFGYYPYFSEGKNVYSEKLQNTINLILNVDLPAARSIDFNSINKIRKLLSIITTSVPFKPNTHKISVLTEISRTSLIQFIALLEKAQLLNVLYTATKGIQNLAKPDKIYLNNTNLMFALTPWLPDKGNLRETFFLNQTKYSHEVLLPDTGDFLVDQQFLFEVGGKNKTRKQIGSVENAFIVADDIEYGFEKKIPLWLFGFQY